MLLTITTTYQPATDLGYLLHKNPARLQTVDISAGQAHIFYPEATAEKCTAALLLDIDPIGLVRNAKTPSGEGFVLEHYVNDRPYVASSFMSVAIAQAFSTAMNGRCKDKPELAEQKLPLEVKISVLPVRGGESFLRKIFEPLGYTLEVERHQLDEQLPEFGESRYFTVTLRHHIRIADLLSHLYVLIPVLDNDKHYWVSPHEVEKLMAKGEGWLSTHPEKEQITKRYLKNLVALTREAFVRLLEGEPAPEEEAGEENGEEEAEVQPEKRLKISLHQQRLELALEELTRSGATKVLDLGCGEGKLLRMLIKEKQFTEILGLDVSYRSLQIAAEKLNRLPPKIRERVKLIQGALTYRDKRLEGYDAAAIVEVIEHLDEARLAALERVVFEFARPKTVVVTTPNAEYNQKFESLPAGKFRHSDHRFEWTRHEFEQWARRVGDRFGYSVTFTPVGEEDAVLGAPSQMGVFSK